MYHFWSEACHLATPTRLIDNKRNLTKKKKQKKMFHTSISFNSSATVCKWVVSRWSAWLPLIIRSNGFAFRPTDAVFTCHCVFNHSSLIRGLETEQLEGSGQQPITAGAGRTMKTFFWPKNIHKSTQIRQRFVTSLTFWGGRGRGRRRPAVIEMSNRIGSRLSTWLTAVLPIRQWGQWWP